MDQISTTFDPSELHVRARWARTGDRLTILVSGELDLASCPPLSEHLAGVVRPGDHVVVDLAEITFCGASGIRWMVDLHSQVSAGGGRLVLRDPSPIVGRVLAVTGSSDRFEVVGPKRRS